MRQDIGQTLTFEIKQDIATRYFGFRKLIEDDKMALTEKIRQYSFILEKRISFDLIRIYIILRDEALIEDFLKLTGLDQKMFYDPYFIESKTIRKRVFEGVKLRGLTKKGCYKNALMDCYDRLVNHVEQYREKFAELIDDQEVINEEIKIFYKKNNLSTILGFLRSLGDTGLTGHMQGGMEPDIASDMDQKLQLAPPPPISESLPIIPPLAPLSAIRKGLKRIGGQAFDLHKMDIHCYLSDNCKSGDK